MHASLLPLVILGFDALILIRTFNLLLVPPQIIDLLSMTLLSTALQCEGCSNWIFLVIVSK